MQFLLTACLKWPCARHACQGGMLKILHTLNSAPDRSAALIPSITPAIGMNFHVHLGNPSQSGSTILFHSHHSKGYDMYLLWPIGKDYFGLYDPSGRCRTKDRQGPRLTSKAEAGNIMHRPASLFFHNPTMLHCLLGPTSGTANRPIKAEKAGNCPCIHAPCLWGSPLATS